MAEGFHKSRLPSFSDDEIKYIRGSADFLGLNYYTTFYTKDRIPPPIGEPSSEKDTNVINYQDPNWPTGSLHDFKSVPWGFRKVFNYVKKNYGDPEILITENGFPDLEEINDVGSVSYYNDHLNTLLDAIEVDGVNVTMYTTWSLMDNFEWTAGYTARFGLHHVDFENPDLKRTPKASARYFKELMKTKTLWKSVTL
ncbi:hypothetical protein RI129_004419 [Pyrocoelia pectoralis]|uniref:Beta-glucosidase n=1 Tax=Pyrocoelia pectoralis TaxID=417401 RepID=A0AAN7VCB2_9COLE